jgi:glycine/D-amino acid oxidase-like deaminating enzyme
VTGPSRPTLAALNAAADRALADARPAVLWTDTPDAPDPDAPLAGSTRADLVVIGGGLTGLWAAIGAREEDPSGDVLLLEAGRVGSGGSGRNGGFISASLTHGLAHGARMWPREIGTLVRMGRENLAAIAAFVERHAIDADLRLCGKTTVAVRPHEVSDLEVAHDLHRRHGEDVELLDRERMRADVDSPTYRAGLRQRSGSGLVDPARLTWGLARVARGMGVRVHEGSAVIGLARTRAGVRVATARGTVQARRVVVATNGFPSPLRRLRAWVLPVYDHVLATEPLGADRLRALGWADRQGITDAGNRFHYYRLTRDDRLVWGGWDAVYHFGNRVDPALEQREATHRLLARHLLETFPQLEGVRVTHRWGGVIDTTSRFTPVFGTAMGGRVAYAVGYTGLGVGSSRFGARVALDLLAGRRTERTELAMVRWPPLPFPPEPLRWLAVQATALALARQDREAGRRGAWLRLLDRLGVGFTS